MKPLRLTLEGINSFTDARTVDFERLGQNGIFCICGPTGSGKTTILDCVILALYAPSNHNRGTLKDYINTGCDKGKITLDFTSDGVTYRVYRELRRNSSSLAKLYNLDTGEVLADKADTTTDAVKKMLKLDKDDFTKVVVLEQGKYAEFMSMGKAKRYETVAKLFNLERFDVLKDKVAEAKRRYEGEAENIRAALAEYEDVTEAALAAQKKEKKQLQQEIESARKEESAAAEKVQAGEQQKSAAALRAKAQADEIAAQATLAAWQRRREQIDAAQKALGEEAQKTEQLRKESERAHTVLHFCEECEQDEKAAADKEKQAAVLREEYKRCNAEATAQITLLEKLFARENELRANKEKEERARDEARQRYEDARRENAAAVLRVSLCEGDVCPVCGGAYHGGAHNKPVAGEQEIAAFKSAWEKSEKALAALGEEWQKNLQSRVTAESKRNEWLLKRDSVTEEGKRLADEAKKFRERIAERLGGKTPDKARTDAQNAVAAYERAKKAWEQNSEKLRGEQERAAADRSAAQEKLAAAQNTLAALPSAAFDEAAFAAAQAHWVRCRAQAAELTERLGGATARIAHLETQLQKKKELSGARKQAEATLKNVMCLYACTNKDKLLSFVAEQYVQSFTASGGETLFALTGGKYTLCYEDGEFYVTDFFADNARRKVKTLSGGETFLASMSIAMAISREIAAQNYEFFFLDEGFGTLHERAVETVADALNELSRDTTVGIVTHRTELADRIASRLTVVPATEDTGSDVVYNGT